jgi:hypothetical protein
MATAAILRARLEATLSSRIPAAFSLKFKQPPDLVGTGVAAVDALLDGGIPRGSITEICGETSTGKTSLALSVVSSMTQSGNVCAWVDANDTLLPESAAAAGIALKHLLWLRIKTQPPMMRLGQALKANDLLLQAGGFGAIVLDLSDVSPQQAIRIPLATWYRYRLSAEQARTALILLTPIPCAKSCSALAIRCEAASVIPCSTDGRTALFEQQQYILTYTRNRNEDVSLRQKKPSMRCSWSAETTWSMVR